MSNTVKNLKTYLMTGVSYMLPFIVSGGMLIAIGTILGKFDLATLQKPLQTLGYGIFGFIPHIIGAYVAFGMADRPGIAPGFAGGYIASEIGAGFLGGILAGLIAGVVVNKLKKVPFHKYISSLKPMLFIPLVGVGITAGIMALIGTPISWLQSTLDAWLKNLSGANAVILGAVLGGMLAFDMGGPLNKIALTFVIGAYSQQIFGPNAAAFAGIMTPPISVAIATWVAPKKFNKIEKDNAIATLCTGLFGITEGAIPYAATSPLRVIPAFVIGSAVGGALIMAFGVETQVFGGILAFPFTEKWLPFIFSLAVGIGVSVILLSIFKKEIEEESFENSESIEILDI
ncbi:PTS fructose transporter subunit IIC [Caldisalinibacter kiritimatiensis]|uniref:PTS system, fructose-specific component IIA / IIB / IIC n=1 Tax=Caldisalinibacter kiritimatiensis TaxID=1304284 RepID=R1CTC6_9FIRM|nr:PTS fructose transporter subunit IIC [Caldisalinibacter kiritimatiensis]EOC99938.1 PTS system, fructose-specific component IIA / IIB / IIC [Caldisalinibacter kiritimatiensis]